jgi:flagellar basal-body rod protein FlgF
MVKSLHTAGLGMMARQQAQDVIANNLANANTPGFQREIAQFQRQTHVIPAGSGSKGPREKAEMSVSAVTDTHTGAVHSTGNSGDLALEGNGYFVVKTPQGERLIRSGSMRVDKDGDLVDPSGNALLSTGGSTLKVGNAHWDVREDGSVLAGGAPIGKLKIVRPTGGLSHEGGTLLAAGQTRDVADGAVKVRQGFLEGSNVETVREMVDMMAGMRAYESTQRAVMATDDSLQQLLTVLQK